MTRYVKTDYDGCKYITAGKVYEAFDWQKRNDFFVATFLLKDDDDELNELSLCVCPDLLDNDWIECTADGTPLSEVDAAKPNTDANWEALTSDVMEAFGEAFQEQPDYLDKRLAQVIAEHLNQKGYVRVEYEEGE